MKRGAFRLTLSLPLLLTLGGCDGGRGIYYALKHRIIMVPTEAMVPKIRPGDRAAVDERYYSEHPVQRFDMVTFKLPLENMPDDMPLPEENTIYLKRVIGLGGEVLEIKGGRVYINGRALDEPYTTVPLTERDAFGPVNIPEGEFFPDGRQPAEQLRRQVLGAPSSEEAVPSREGGRNFPAVTPRALRARPTT